MNLKIPYVVYPILFGLMCAWLMASIVESFSVRPNPLPVVKVKKEVKKVNIGETAKIVINKNIFNLTLSPIPEYATGSNGEGGAPATPFNGKLIGIINNVNNNAGIAIINTDGETVIIKIGNEKNGVKLLGIDNITASIEKNNRKYSVKLEGGEVASRIPAASNEPPAVTSSGGNLNIAIKKSEVQAELKDLNKVLQSALVSPLYNNGEFTGYKVTRILDTSPLKKLGLNQGDIITRVNGSELKTPEVLFSMLSKIDEISAISIDMIRDNDKKTLFVELQ